MQVAEPNLRDYAAALDPLLMLGLGALLGFALTGLQSFLDRVRCRKSLASGLLIEIRTLEHAISLRYNDVNAAGSRGRLATPVFDKLTSDLLLLRHDHLYAVLQFYGFVGDVNQHLENARARVAEGEALDHNAHHRVRLKSQFALATIHDAKMALEQAGGTLPERSALHGTRPVGLPPAPPRQFDNYPDD